MPERYRRASTVPLLEIASSSVIAASATQRDIWMGGGSRSEERMYAPGSATRVIVHRPRADRTHFSLTR